LVSGWCQVGVRLVRLACCIRKTSAKVGVTDPAHPMSKIRGTGYL
jgi:hypothetical protein